MKNEGTTKRRYHGLVSLVLGAAAMLLAGCQPGLKRPDPIHAIWVTRMDYKSEADVTRIMENCKSLNLNTVLFQVRGNGTVFYRSKIEPWAEQFDFRDPGFDPLAIAVREAHKRGLWLEAYVNVMPAWQGPGVPAIRNQLYHTHPEWFWYDKAGHRQPIHHQVGEHERDWYVSLNPCLPEVRTYLVGVFRELVSHYDVDGLHLDYIRFPNEPVVTGESIPDYPRDRRTLELYRAATGKSPDDDPALWNRWRADQVTQLMRDIRNMLRRTRPGATLTCSVGGDPKRSASTHFQDSLRWARERLVDVLYVMNYTSDPAEFRQRMSNWSGVPDDVTVVQGIGAWRLGSTEALRNMVETAAGPDGDFCLFAYRSFFASAEDGRERASRGEESRQARRAAMHAYFGE